VSILIQKNLILLGFFDARQKVGQNIEDFEMRNNVAKFCKFRIIFPEM